MIEFIKALFEKWSCRHKWIVHNKTKVYGYYNLDSYLYTKETLICTECGKIKRIKT